MKKYGVFKSTILILLIIFVLCPEDAYSQKGKKLNTEPGTFNSIEDALKVDPTTVYKLNLSKNKLKEFPSEVFKFPNLMQLDLSRNKIQNIPDEIGKLSKLTYLNLSKNKIQEIPDEIGNLKSLNSFKISQNKVSKLPLGFYYIYSLEIVDLYSNPLEINPELFSKKGKIKYIDIRNTEVTSEQCKRISELLMGAIIKCDKKGCGCNK